MVEPSDEQIESLAREIFGYVPQAQVPRRERSSEPSLFYVPPELVTRGINDLIQVTVVIRTSMTAREVLAVLQARTKGILGTINSRVEKTGVLVLELLALRMDHIAQAVKGAAEAVASFKSCEVAGPGQRLLAEPIRRRVQTLNAAK